MQLQLARLPAASTPRIEAALDAIAVALESEASPAAANAPPPLPSRGGAPPPTRLKDALAAALAPPSQS